MYGWQGHHFGPQAKAHYYAPPHPRNPIIQPAQPRKAIRMIESKALWCDTGGHPFSSKDPEKKRTIEETTVKNRYDEDVTEQEESWCCGECRRKLVEFLQSKFQPTRKELQEAAKATVVDTTEATVL